MTESVPMDESTEVQTGGNSLLKAVSLSRLRLTRLLLEGGAYINESNEHGETPLMVACKTRHTDSQSVPKHKMVRYLLENGADPNIQDKTGKTALMHACLQQAGPEILSLLLSSGANPTLEDRAGLSALVYAVNTGNTDVLRVLLDACKMKGKEVIIITTNKMPTGHQVTKQYLNVPPPTDFDERLHYSPMSCCRSAHEVQLPASPQGSLRSASSQPNSLLLGTGPGLAPSPHQCLCPAVPVVDEPVDLQRLHLEQWTKSQSPVLQRSQISASGQPAENMSKKEWSVEIGNAATRGKVSRHNSVDVKDTTGLPKALENTPGSVNREGSERRPFARKMSYDSAAGSLHSASNPNLHQEQLPFGYESSPVDEDSSDCLTKLNVSSLQNVVHRRNIGMNHYSSDSQLPQFGFRFGSGSKNGAGLGVGPERYKLLTSKSSTMSGSRESLESSVQKCDAARLEQRGSGTQLQDHIAHTRPRYLPPLNPHASLLDSGVTCTSLHSLTGSNKTLNVDHTGPKPVPLCAPIFPRNPKANKILWRRHSIQTEQIKQLANFEERFGH